MITIWTVAGAILLVALGSTLLTVWRDGRPGPKRTHLFEADGERANPFSEISGGAADGTGLADDCARCGATLEESYRFCVACGSAPVADD